MDTSQVRGYLCVCVCVCACALGEMPPRHRLGEHLTSTETRKIKPTSSSMVYERHVTHVTATATACSGRVHSHQCAWFWCWLYFRWCTSICCTAPEVKSVAPLVRSLWSPEVWVLSAHMSWTFSLQKVCKALSPNEATLSLFVCVLAAHRVHFPCLHSRSCCCSCCCCCCCCLFVQVMKW
jgi:hypothetical protein